MSKPYFALLLLLAALARPLVCEGADSGHDVPPPDQTAGVDLRDPEVIERGMQTLNTTCGGYCHGSSGRGYKGPPLRNRPDLSPDGMLATIKFGRKRAGKLMPAWNGTLTEQEMWTVIAAIVSLRDAEGGAGSGTKGGGH
jgi:mono/diheme cytochrome c family protein